MNTTTTHKTSTASNSFECNGTHSIDGILGITGEKSGKNERSI